MRRRLVIDKEFLDKFLISYQEDNPEHVDLRKFFKKIRDFELLINVNDLDDLKIAADNNPLLEELIDTKPPATICNPGLVESIGKNSFFEEQPPYTLFFIESGNDEQAILRAGYENINSFNLCEKWKIYCSVREDLKRKVTKDRDVPKNLRFDSWTDLKQFAHPVHSIFIFDRYILADKSNQRIMDNLLPLLKNLLNISSSSKPVEITIISQCDDLMKEFKKLKDMLSMELKVPFHLNLYKHDKSYYPRNFEGLHFRRVFTNYFTLKPDDSFNFFKRNGDVNNIAEISILFSFNNADWVMTKSDLQHLKDYISEIERLSAQNAVLDKVMVKEGPLRLIN